MKWKKSKNYYESKQKFPNLNRSFGQRINSVKIIGLSNMHK